MAHIDLEIYSEDPAEVAALQAYWTLAEDGETWVQTVTEIRTQHGLKPQDMTRIVQTCGTAFLADIKCTQCGEAKSVANRTQFAELLRQENVLCDLCRSAAQEEREEAERQLVAARQAAVVEVFPVYHAGPIEVGDLSLFQAVALHALFGDPAVEDAGLTTPTNIWPKERRWAPDNLSVDLERRLLKSDRRVICIHHDSHPDAFVWEDEAPTGAFYLGAASYYLVGPEDELRNRSPRLLRDLNQVFREGPWPKAWFSQWRDLWDELALSYASTYLDMKLNEHHLEMKQGDGTRSALIDALATFSLGQVFNFIYRATKDSAAYYQRGGVNKRQAANSTVGRISAAADRARANEWDIKSFGRPWSLPLSAMGETFFSKVMWQADFMQVVGRSAHPPQHAAEAEVPEAEPESPEISDDDINDCVQCGRRFYGEGLCTECTNG